MLSALSLSLLAPMVGRAASLWPIIETNYGLIQGVIQHGVAQFLGVPYGEDTGGENRFMPPRPPRAWTGVRSVVALSDRAPQTPAVRPEPAVRAPDYNIWSSFEATEPESENCLTLNIWTPGVDERKRPVMVWLHPGGFATGAGAEPPTLGHNLARFGDVVVVSINHRLSALGYFYLEGVDSTCQGAANAGQLDQIAALEWVRDNIARFGGDPANVTIFGQSGGGAKVCTLMAMPGAQGLFHKAICQSGSYIECASPELATEAAVELMARLGLKSSQIAELQGLPAESIISAWALMPARFKRGFTPVRNGNHIPFDPFSPGALELSAQVPLMIGSTRDEATSLCQDAEAFELTWNTLPRKWAEWYARNVNPEYADEARVAAQIAAFRKAYPDETASQIFFRFASDIWTILNAIDIADRKSDFGGAPVYMYEVAFSTPVDGGRWGSPHSVELPLIFGTISEAPSIVQDTPAARAVGYQMRSCWVNFARHGRPHNPTIPAWKPFSRAERPALQFDWKTQLVNDYRGKDRDILRGLPTMRV
jgi:para-nitrobenzyl esterase